MGKYVVVDLEMCMVKSRKPICQEVIQIGAVLLDESFDVIDRFSTYVKPEFGWLDATIVNLTGIRGTQLKGAPDFKSGLDKFLSWLPDEALTFVEWSTSDEAQLRKECLVKGIEDDRLKRLLSDTSDCQKLFSRKIDRKKNYRLSEALTMADISFEGHEHDGLDDAYNTALLFAKLNREEELVLNPLYEEARSEECDTLSYSLAYLFKDIHIA